MEIQSLLDCDFSFSGRISLGVMPLLLVMDSDGLLVPSMNIIYTRQGDKQMKEKDTTGKKERKSSGSVIFCIPTYTKRTHFFVSLLCSTHNFQVVLDSIFIFDEVSQECPLSSSSQTSIVKSNYEPPAPPHYFVLNYYILWRQSVRHLI